MRLKTCWTAIAFVAVATPAVAQTNPALPAPIAQVLQGRNIAPDALGAVLIRLRDGHVLWAHRAEVPLQPASTMKTVTSIVALEKLGPDFRAKVEWVSDAPVESGVLKGDVTLRGLGHPEFTFDDLRRTIEQLRRPSTAFPQGIQRIAGNINIDRHHFRPARMDIGVPAFDETPEFRYNVIPDALALNTNLVSYRFQSDRNSISITTEPRLSGVTLVSNMQFSDKPCARWEDEWKLPTVVTRGDETRIFFEGQFPRDCVVFQALNLLDRATLTARVVADLWRAFGGALDGVVQEAPAAVFAPDAKPRVLAEHRARPLAEVVRTVNKISDNPVTRSVFLSLGATADADPAKSTRDNADAAVRAWLRSKNIDATGLVLDNGSGLSRSERISALTLARVLEAAAKSRWAPEFTASLPIVGTDGSMRNRLKNSAVAEFARFKTGSLRNVVSVAGYVSDTRGERYVLTAMINDDRAIQSGGREVLDRLIEAVATSAPDSAR
jgi:D-alanyl-D-alanine carboxypeptidase/D-alanyl-D-alanine-endopeptidase (penicillin-binding protein 4)